MRLTPHEVTVIKSVIKKHLGDVEVYLFGSRVNDRARGGDIDILIIGEREEAWQALTGIRIDLQDALGDQKIDLVYQRKGALTPFAELVLMESVAL